ncbi:MAG: DUF2333 family protein [Alphaproteobacteria bacterium]|jgi:hypothetical protein|nr:DUF2333 family protein [Alphaproteobacteria bacterium]
MTRHELDWEDEYSAPKRRIVPRVARAGGMGVVGLIGLVVLYYIVGMAMVHRVSDDTTFESENVDPGASGSVAIAAALIDREINKNSWVANDPFFKPGVLLDNMPNFQQGVVYALSRFALELSDQLGRTRGSSEVDKDLDKAAGLLKYPGNIWIWDLSTSWKPTAPSEDQYKAARESLLAYNKRVATGEATFERRADNLQGTLLRFTADIGSSSAIIDQHLTLAGGWGVDTKVDDIFYSTKGRLYGYYMVLRELGRDFDKVIADRELSASWARMLDSLRQAASLDPIIVVNGAPDGALMPSHLASLGFYLLRARTQLREITNILQK